MHTHRDQYYPEPPYGISIFFLGFAVMLNMTLVFVGSTMKLLFVDLFFTRDMIRKFSEGLVCTQRAGRDICTYFAFRLYRK